MPTTTGNATQLITFSRGSLATVTDSDGRIKWAPHNLLSASEQFDASSWTRQGLSGVTANSIAAPNGTTTADKITENGLNDFHYVVQTSVIDDSAPVSTLSVFAKAAERQYLNLAMSWGANYVAATFNVSGGTVTSNRTGGTGASQSSSITSIGSGWYLCTLRGTIGTTGSDAASIALSNTDTPTGVYPQYTGTSGHGMHLWGASLTRSDLGGMQANASAYPYYNPSTPRNLLGWSEAFDNAAWTKDAILAFGSGSVANAIAAPNGSLTADLLTESNTNATHVAYQSVNLTTGGVRYTYSAYFRAGARTSAMLRIGGGTYSPSSDAPAVRFLLTGSGTATTISTGSTVVSSSITPVGDGWYRCSILFTSGPGTSHAPNVGPHDGSSSISYAGDGTSGVYVWGAQLSDSASLDPYVGSYGAAPSAAAAHGPRLDYDPVTLAARGLLVEEQRANLLLNSAAFDAASWSKTNLNTTGTPAWVNVEVAPDGTSTADKLVEDTSNGVHYTFALITPSANTVYTTSVYAKAGERTRLQISAAGAYASYSTIVFDLSAGTVVTTTGSFSNGQITPVGNGWYRCSVVATSISSPVQSQMVQFATVQSGTTVSYTGDGTSGLFLWGAQLEAGSFATSYIPTAASTVTRNADVASVATSQFPYSASEGTIVVNVSDGTARVGSSVALMTFDDGNGGYDNSRQLYFLNDAGDLRAYESSNNAVSVDQIAYNGPTNGTLTGKIAYAYKTNDFASSFNGASAIALSTSGNPAQNIYIVGIGSDRNANVNGSVSGRIYIRQITYIPRRLSNAELQARSV